MTKKYDNAIKLHEGKEILKFMLVANDKATKVTQPVKDAFDLSATFVATQLATILRLRPGPIAAMERNHLGALIGQLGVPESTVIDLVEHHHNHDRLLVSGLLESVALVSSIVFRLGPSLTSHYWFDERYFILPIYEIASNKEFSSL